MAKANTQYVCQTCGTVTPKWAGKCEACDAWNSLVAETTAASPFGAKGNGPGKGRASRLQVVGLNLEPGTPPQQRLVTAMAEFDRVVGGGLVPGSALLIGGDPGIGKSTILLQVVAKLAMQNLPCLYISGEESIDQVRLRAERLGLAGAPVGLATTTDVREIIATLESREAAPALVVIDSIQTMYLDTVESAPGTVTQVRACTHELIRAAKKNGVCLLFVGHVTKDGQIAGPRVLEHMVDTVLYFEGDRGHQFRILRTVKNRFGPTDEIGVFAMSGAGLEEVLNPSELFLAQRQTDAPGSAVLAGLEGTRPVLVEIQALVAATAYGTPRRAVIGWDTNRLAMVLAVLETRCGIAFSGLDVFLNVAGGLKITEPATDLAVMAALLSAQSGVPVPHQMVFFGEIGLGGEIRQVPQADLRLREAGKLGFQQAVIPARPKKEAGKAVASSLALTEIRHVTDMVGLLGELPTPAHGHKNARA
jgi:DNA repair protein RadA/Sms